MSFTDVFENSKIRLKVKIKRGPQKPPKCTFKFEVEDGDAIADKKGTIVGTDATCEITLPLCKDIDKSGTLQEFYTVAYKVIDEDDNNQEYAGTETYKVWPKNVKVKLFKEESGSEKTFAGAPFTLKQKDAPDIKGTMVPTPSPHPRTKPGPITLVPSPNYKVKTWKKGTETEGREREAVLEASFEAAFLSPRSGTKIEQAVNQPSAVNQFGTDGNGNQVTVTIGAKGDEGKADAADRTAIPDAHIFIKATFSRSSGRTSPEPTLIAEPGFDLEEIKLSTDKKTCTARAKVSADKIAKFKVELGKGGGEECKIQIGTIKDKFTDTLEFQNWRTLKYELWMPANSGAGKMTDYTKFKADNSAGLSTTSTDYFKKTLDKVFIKFTSTADNFLAKADIPANGDHNIIDADYVKKDAGNKVLVLELDQAKAILDAKAVNGADPRIITMIWCDHLCDPKAWNDSYVVVENNEEINTGDLRVFKKAVVATNGVAHGDYPIKSLFWKVSHYKDGDWKEVTAATDPGGAFKDWSEISDEAGIKAHVEFLKYDTIKFKFPSTTAGFPGKELTMTGGKPTAAGKSLAVTFFLSGAATEMGFNGAALQGTVWMNTHSGTVHHVGMGRTVLHELGHNMGMAYGSIRDLSIRGQPDTNEIPGIPFPKPVPVGFVYDDNWGHTGGHCTFGLNTNTRKLPNFATSADAWNQRKCIMFGAGDMSLSQEFEFCPHCAKQITGQDLSTIRKNWKV
jgi:hypothetical protein